MRSPLKRNVTVMWWAYLPFLLQIKTPLLAANENATNAFVFDDDGDAMCVCNSATTTSVLAQQWAMEFRLRAGELRMLGSRHYIKLNYYLNTPHQ
eukprot:scaffold37469_cov76-Attheya_sp.AAC.1